MFKHVQVHLKVNMNKRKISTFLSQIVNFQFFRILILRSVDNRTELATKRRLRESSLTNYWRMLHYFFLPASVFRAFRVYNDLTKTMFYNILWIPKLWKYRCEIDNCFEINTLMATTQTKKCLQSWKLTFKHIRSTNIKIDFFHCYCTIK